MPARCCAGDGPPCLVPLSWGLIRNDAIGLPVLVVRPTTRGPVFFTPLDKRSSRIGLGSRGQANTEGPLMSGCARTVPHSVSIRDSTVNSMPRWQKPPPGRSATLIGQCGFEPHHEQTRNAETSAPRHGALFHFARDDKPQAHGASWPAFVDPRSIDSDYRTGRASFPETANRRPES